MKQGWIALHRKILDDIVWKGSTPEQKTILISLLLLVDHQSNEWEWKKAKFKTQPGQTITSIDSIVKACGKGIKTQNVRSALKRFEKLDFLTNESTKTGRLITIMNWHTYQDIKSTPNKAPNKDLTKWQQRPNKDLTPNNNVNNADNVKNVNKKELTTHMDKKIQENKLQNHEAKLLEFVDYRKTIKKPFKSKQGITGFINVAKKLNDMKLDVDKCFDYTMEKEWQLPPMDYFKNNIVDFKAEKESVLISLDGDIYGNSDYQLKGFYKTSEVIYINLLPQWIGDDERSQVEIDTAKFVEKYCNGVS